jgi:hypothetical protein
MRKMGWEEMSWLTPYAIHTVGNCREAMYINIFLHIRHMYVSDAAYVHSHKKDPLG